MHIVKEVFYDMREIDYIQLEILKDEINKNCNKEIINIREIKETIDILENDKLDYSNDLIIDMIIKGIINNTENNELKELLGTTFVVVDTVEKQLIARAYPRYEDNSYLVEIGKDIYCDIDNMSDVLASIILITVCSKKYEKIAYTLLIYNLEKLKHKDSKIKQKIDTLVYNYGDEEFTELYVKIAREIFEVAIAFLVGHEIGHHYYGHTSNRENEIVDFEQSDEINSVNDFRLNEFVADKFSIGFVYEFLSAYDNNINIQQGCGYYIPFLATALNVDILKGTDSHPAMLMRILCLKEYLLKVFARESSNMITIIIGELCKALSLVGEDFSWWNKKYEIKNGIIKWEVKQ